MVTTLTNEGLQEMQTDFTNMLQAILWMLDGARYLWEGVEACENQSEVSDAKSASFIAKDKQK